MDVAKLLAALCGSGQALADMYGIGKVQGPRLPLVLMPTTAGTGSEATAIPIVTTGETTKSGVVSPFLMADLAILDAELTLGLPPAARSEEHTSELQSLMRISYAVFCLQKNN